jgi:hypothetical protein
MDFLVRKPVTADEAGALYQEHPDHAPTAGNSFPVSMPALATSL